MQMEGDGGAARRSRWHKQVGERGEDVDETLQAAPRSEPLHRSLPLSQRDMGIFGAVIQTLVRSMIDARHDLSPGCGIGAELVSDHAPRAAALLMEKPL